MNTVLIGKLVKPHGLKGEIKAAFFVDDLQELKEYSHFFVLDKKSPTGYKDIVFDKIRLMNDQIIVTLQGCSSRDQAELLKAIDIFVDEKEVPKLKGDSYYIRDLIDCEAFDGEGLIGKVLNVFEAANKNLLLVQLKNQKQVAIPFTGEYIDEVKIDQKQVILKNINDLL